MSRRVGSRALAVGSLAAAVGAAFVAVTSGLANESTPASAHVRETHSVAFGDASVVVRPGAPGTVCFRVTRSGANLGHSCVSRPGASEIAYAASPSAVGGVAGPDVRAVIVRLTRKGTIWATLRDGAFYAEVPPLHAVRAVVKIVRGGTRTTFTVKERL